MAHFRASIKGQRGEASRLGSKKTGIQATINGWNNGIRVVGEHDENTGEDRFTVYFTGGSNGGKPSSRVFVSTDKGVSTAQEYRQH